MSKGNQSKWKVVVWFYGKDSGVSWCYDSLQEAEIIAKELVETATTNSTVTLRNIAPKNAIPYYTAYGICQVTIERGRK